jgi:hypothetical protein
MTGSEIISSNANAKKRSVPSQYYPSPVMFCTERYKFRNGQGARGASQGKRISRHSHGSFDNRSSPRNVNADGDPVEDMDSIGPEPDRNRAALRPVLRVTFLHYNKIGDFGDENTPWRRHSFV